MMNAHKFPRYGNRLLLLVLVTLVVPVQAALPAEGARGHPLPSLAPMIDKVAPAVVNIATYAEVHPYNPLLQHPFFQRFFDLPRKELRSRKRPVSAGSGVIVNAEKGYIITNAHVIRGADIIQVTLKDGRTATAELIGKDLRVDLALLQVDMKNLTDIDFAEPGSLRVGDFVVAIGNPFGLGHTVTSGIVSALGRSNLDFKGYENFIQTDASINPGNSGGALVNLNGELVGINTAIISPGGGNVGIGFAIPVGTVKKVMTQLIRYGEVRRGMLGVETQTVNADLADAFGLKHEGGVVVTRVEPGSSAERAGLMPGDIITAVNGQAISEAGEFRHIVSLTPLGQTLTLSVLRAGERKTITARIRKTRASIRAWGRSISVHLAGARLQTLEPGESRWVQHGVRVLTVEPRSPAWRIGLRAGDVLVSANGHRLADLDSLRQAVNNPRAALVLRVRRNRGVFRVMLR